MKILIVRTFASILSATSYNVQEIGLAKAYVKLGHSVDIVMYGGKEATHSIDIPTDEGKTIRLFYMKSYGVLKNGIFPGLKKFADGYDLIQVHEYDQFTSWLFYTDKKLKDKVIIYHGPYYSDYNKRYNLKCKIFDELFLRFKNNPDCPCFTKSNAAITFLEGKGFKNVKAVGVGLDIGVWDGLYSGCDRNFNNIKDSNDVKRDRFTYLYIGKLEPRRNTLFLLDVVDALLEKHDDMDFLLIGDGEEDYKKLCLDKTNKWIEAGRLKYIKKVNQDEVPSIYKSVDCMLFPSNYEIFGMVLMEAYYFGLPVITSDNGGADTLYSNGVNAIVIDSNKKKNFDINEWVEAAEKIYLDEELRQKIKKQINESSNKLSWDSIAAGILG